MRSEELPAIRQLPLFADMSEENFAALMLEGVDDRGLTKLDRRYLKTIIDFYRGGPVGIEALAATLQEEADTLVDVVEPYLLKLGFLMRTSSGRKASDAAHKHLGITYQKGLFRE